jgi:hypothetical protein
MDRVDRISGTFVLKACTHPGMLTHSYNPRTWETEGEESQV